jgi:hypothetical protein
VEEVSRYGGLMVRVSEKGRRERPVKSPEQELLPAITPINPGAEGVGREETFLLKPPFSS